MRILDTHDTILVDSGRRDFSNPTLIISPDPRGILWLDIEDFINQNSDTMASWIGRPSELGYGVVNDGLTDVTAVQNRHSVRHFVNKESNSPAFHG